MRAKTLVLLLFVVGHSMADVDEPDGLSPGDKYRLVFVTPGLFPFSTEIDEYNSYVNAEVINSPLEDIDTKWKAVVSTASVDARENTSTVPGDTRIPIFKLPQAIRTYGMEQS